MVGHLLKSLAGVIRRCWSGENIWCGPSQAARQRDETLLVRRDHMAGQLLKSLAGAIRRCWSGEIIRQGTSSSCLPA